MLTSGTTRVSLSFITTSSYEECSLICLFVRLRTALTKGFSIFLLVAKIWGIRSRCAPYGGSVTNTVVLLAYRTRRTDVRSGPDHARLNDDSSLSHLARRLAPGAHYCVKAIVSGQLQHPAPAATSQKRYPSQCRCGVLQRRATAVFAVREISSLTPE